VTRSRYSLRRWIAPFALLALSGGGSGCQKQDLPETFDHDLTLGGRTVTGSSLQRGAVVFTQSCRPCHGATGAGDGPASIGLRPPPRNLRLGTYKFAAVAAGQLTTDDDFRRIIRGGLHGTAMLPWDLPQPQLDDVIQYIKTFSDRWQTESAGEPITLSADPWTTRADAGIERGKRVYHGMAQCGVACHPAYVTRSEIFDFTAELTKMRVEEFRADLYAPIAKASDYGFAILPPDFTFNILRSGDGVADIARVVASGIGGTAMPTWKNVLPDADLWAMAHYVKSLTDLRDTDGSTNLRARLKAQAPWTPPPRTSAPD